MRSRILTLLLTLPALAACSGGASAEPSATTDEERTAAAWRADLEKALESKDVDLEPYTRQATVDCQRTETQDWIPTLVMSGDLGTTSEVTLIGLEHACPAVADAYEAAVAAVENAPEPLDLVCGSDVELSSEDALKADMVCASR